VGGLSPISRADFVRRLHELGFEGPYAGGKHPFLVRGVVRVIVPNPHRRDMSAALLGRILKQAGISVREWVEG